MKTRLDIANSPWQKVPLGEISEFKDNLRRPVKAADRKPGPYPYYGANGQQGTIDGFLFDEELVLLAEDGGYFAAADARPIAYRITGKSWVNNHAHVLAPGDAVDGQFLTFMLSQYDVSTFLTGTTRAKLTKSAASLIPIPLPPLHEQRRIVDILNRSASIERLRAEAREKLRAFIPALFIKMFGDPVENPKGWEVKPLGDLMLGGSRNGLSPSKRGQIRGSVLTLSAITRGKFDPQSVKESTFGTEIPTTQQVSRGLFLVCRGNGNIDLVGRGQVATQDMPGVAFPDTMISVRTDTARVRPVFLECLWETEWFRRQIILSAKTTNGTHKINQQAIKEYLVPVPPVDLQDRFAEIVSASRAIAGTADTASTTAAALSASLMARLFGETADTLEPHEKRIEEVQ